MTPIQRFTEFLESLSPETIGEVDALYAEQIDFKDPMNAASDREHFKRIEADLFKQLKNISFEVTNALGDESEAMVKWVMRYDFRSKSREIEGVSHLKFDGEGEIYFQHDYWDASFCVYGEFPGLGLALKGIRKMLSVS